MDNYFFVLGAPDHEMREIARICDERQLPFGYATNPLGNIVHGHDAYRATGVTRLIPTGSQIVHVECAVRGLPLGEIIDHHQPGDPGFGKPPAEFLYGSSLGQFLRLIGQEPTYQQMVIAAADHCLTAAYRGDCPGVAVDDLAAWRLKSRSEARGLQPEELLEQIAEAAQTLREATCIILDGVPIPFLEDPPREIGEASARLSQPYIFLRRHDAQTCKSGIRGASPSTVQYWMENCGLERLYGDPQRGFAGGYYPSPLMSSAQRALQ